MISATGTSGRSRKRLWNEEMTSDKLSGYHTMYEIFIGLSQLLAPFIPFITEEIYQNLKTSEMPESVHLCVYPAIDTACDTEDLEKGMEQIRALVESGRALRSKINIKGRHPLPAATIVCSKEIETSTKPLLELIERRAQCKNRNVCKRSNRVSHKIRQTKIFSSWSEIQGKSKADYQSP